MLIWPVAALLSEQSCCIRCMTKCLPVLKLWGGDRERLYHENAQINHNKVVQFFYLKRICIVTIFYKCSERHNNRLGVFV